MASDSVRPLSIPSQAVAELELIELLLDQTSPTYPWNPADPDVWSYCEALEQEIADTWSTEEFQPYVSSLSDQFDQLWETASPAVDLGVIFPTEIFQRFSAQVPSNLLEGIVRRARQVLADNLALADQLVLCVQDLLPTWADDDLYVLARPFAVAMRSGDSTILEGTLQSVRCEAWEALSEIEQARLSLAIARYVLNQQSHPGA
ncbi:MULTISPECIES: hypothetical protein [unclassified Leptolyngbya]|uniref:hypothetical protein n=1 Tax=unclassified Leptolyngbya TaxID=2650499 RepID=UPI0016844A5C|nr:MULTISPECIES: hypothetical protein [unclassified Leptolyngbya]MBD1912479.1 hypothetical protein [Leptolyngbya sp. FACHB-8]MBD2156510.1 hypothetical protein [Leptolyngbya sp. FACHB-16]